MKENNYEANGNVNIALYKLYNGMKPRVTRDVAHYMLMNSPMFYRGKLMHLIGGSVGAGVWEVEIKVKE